MAPLAARIKDARSAPASPDGDPRSRPPAVHRLGMADEGKSCLRRHAGQLPGVAVPVEVIAPVG